jgi:hypothetical protein
VSTPQRHTDDEILAVVQTAPSLADAVAVLKAERSYLRKRCYRSMPLWRAYLACRSRGHDGNVRQWAAPKACTTCGCTGHNRQNCAKRERADRYCAECAGLPWRRPRGIRVLFACGEAWEAEPRVTLDDMFEQPHENRRTLP